jgi:hypothetical protein
VGFLSHKPLRLHGLLREVALLLYFKGSFRPRREEMAGGWREVHNEELHNLYPSPRKHYKGQVKEDKMCREWRIEGGTRNCYRIWQESHNKRDYKEYEDIGVRIILKFISDRMETYGLD